MKGLLFFALALVLASCNGFDNDDITQAKDYDQYLSNTDRKTFQKLSEQRKFWSARLDKDTTGVGNLGPLAGAYTGLFSVSGDATKLKDAENLYKRAIKNSALDKDGFTRGLARNYISQHRFKEAKELLEESYKKPSNKIETNLGLFDVYMELGEYNKAYEKLKAVENEKEFSFLIRRAKWNDHEGKLDQAIHDLELAEDLVKTSSSKELKVWIYTNLGDFYGHDGRIADAYGHYLKALEIQPDNQYAKKGIAWIAYAHDGNTQEADRILDSAMVFHNVPDYHLLKAEMADYKGDKEEKDTQIEKFLAAVNAGPHGEMYNTYLIEIYAEKNPGKALDMAMREVSVNRATPETFDLLAYAQLKMGMAKEALQTYNHHVAGQTFEPMAAYHGALIYKANGMEKDAQELKKELVGAAFELGPVTMREVNKI